MAGMVEGPVSGGVVSIDLAALVANWRALKALHGADVAAVVKADGYGLGARRIVPALHAAGCRHFFVAHGAEAFAIADLVPGAMLAVLNGALPGEEGDFARAGILPVLNGPEDVARYGAAAVRCGRVLPAVLHVDTGMSRLGFAPEAWAALVAAPAALAGISVAYVMTHLAAAETPAHPLNAVQLERFGRAASGLPGVKRSIANSSGVFLGAGFRSDLARPGAALYGVNPTPGAVNPMRPVVSLRVRVLQVREIPAGETVGYEATWRAGRVSRIATACVGYADGWLRALSNRGWAVFDGVKLPLVGRVSMDLVTYDATECPALLQGDWLELIGPAMDVDAVAAAAGTSGYEILTSLGARYARVTAGA